MGWYYCRVQEPLEKEDGFCRCSLKWLYINKIPSNIQSRNKSLIDASTDDYTYGVAFTKGYPSYDAKVRRPRRDSGGAGFDKTPLSFGGIECESVLDGVNSVQNLLENERLLNILVALMYEEWCECFVCDCTLHEEMLTRLFGLWVIGLRCTTWIVFHTG